MPDGAETGCLGRPRTRPLGGWFPERGGTSPPGDAFGPGMTSTDSSPTLTRLADEALSSLPSGYRAQAATEVRSGSCVATRIVRLSAPDGGTVVFVWEQLSQPRSRGAAYRVGPVNWEDRPDGGAVGTDAANPDYQAVTVVLGDGRMLRASAFGARSHSTSGWPTTTAPPPGPLDPAPLTESQLRPLAEKLAAVDQS